MSAGVLKHNSIPLNTNEVAQLKLVVSSDRPVTEPEGLKEASLLMNPQDDKVIYLSFKLVFFTVIIPNLSSQSKI